jgi:hypothetical protein
MLSATTEILHSDKNVKNRFGDHPKVVFRLDMCMCLQVRKSPIMQSRPIGIYRWKCLQPQSWVETQSVVLTLRIEQNPAWQRA